MPEHLFHFRQFSINQDRCAMKIGTDAVLLGSWCKTGSSIHAADLGTGSGILSLMLAQRGLQKVTAIEADMHAAMQASSNFSLSPWPEKFETICADVHHLRESLKASFDLIISNPPFHEGYIESIDIERNKARHATGNPEEFRKNWFETAFELSIDASLLNIIFPYSDEGKWLASAASAGWFQSHLCRIRGNSKAAYSRTMACFTKKPVDSITIEELCIETDKRGVYTDSYKALTEDFYLERVFNRT
jgi:tRNA1Val (adenine37-N6)-methyltransferase